MLEIERDLFNYIFYPTILSEERKNYILNNLVLFKREIELLSSIKSSLTEKITESVRKQIINKIKSFNRKTEIKLCKINYGGVDSDNLVLAADSPKLERKMRADTYIGSDSRFLIKIITNENENKIFVFNENISEMENIKIRIKPSNDIFSFNSTDNPLIIKPKKEISDISIIK